MTWTRSSACTYGNCVEVRHVDGHVEVRDNTAPDTVLHITPADWAAFLVGAKAGEFDGPAADSGQAWQRETVRRWVCDSDPSRVEHTNFVGWSPCPSCRVIEASS